MKYCVHCGKQIEDIAVICVHCGAPASGMRTSGQPAADDAPSTGLAVLCFFFPILGLIFYLVWHDTCPLKAKSCGKGALIGVIVNVALSLLIAFLSAVFGVALFRVLLESLYEFSEYY